MVDFINYYPSWMIQVLKDNTTYLKQKNKPSKYNNLTLTYIYNNDMMFYKSLTSNSMYGLGFNLYQSPYTQMQNKRNIIIKAMIKWRLKNIWNCDVIISTDGILIHRKSVTK